jgi:hypothetical protein
VSTKKSGSCQRLLDQLSKTKTDSPKTKRRDEKPKSMEIGPAKLQKKEIAAA